MPERRITPTQRGEMRQIAVDLPLMAQRLFRVGLVATGHKLQRAVEEIGYEIEREERRRGFLKERKSAVKSPRPATT